MGAKCPCTVQFALGARIVPQVFAKTNDEALVPVIAMVEMESPTVPEFRMTNV